MPSPFRKRWHAHALDLLAPCHCALCGLPSLRGIELCHACESELPWLTNSCLRCALPLATDDAVCGQCLRQPPAFDTAIAACAFIPPVSGFVHAFKFGGQLPVLPVLAAMLGQAVVDHLADWEPPDRIVPMPLHWTRRWRRGFNQATALADHLCRHPLLSDYGLRLDTGICRRHRATAPQRGLDTRGRKRNLAGAFSCRQNLDGETVAIVDDVLTTGASADTLARTLKEAGAARVEIWCCARTLRP